MSQIDRDIASATSENITSAKFYHFVTLFVRLEAMRGVIEGRLGAARLAQASTGVSSALQAARIAYVRPQTTQHAAFWLRIGTDWERARRAPTVAHVDAVFDDLQEVGNELEGDSALDQDPNVAVLDLADLLLRKAPRAIVALRQTVAAVSATRGSRLGVPALEAIVRGRTLEKQSDAIGFSDIALAVNIEPTLQPTFAERLRSARSSTTAFEQQVDALLKTLDARSSKSRSIQTLAGDAIASHYSLWKQTASAIDRLVNDRRARQIARRRVLIALSSIALLASTLVVALLGRYEARRDRVELNSAKLEAEKLRSEVSQMVAERTLRVQEAQLRAIFENAEFGIAIFSLQGTLLRFNSAVTKILGVEMEQILDEQLVRVARFETESQEPFTRTQQHIAKDDRSQWIAFTFSGVYDEGVCQMVILLLRDVTEEKLLEQQLAYKAHHDGLTGLVNRAEFEFALNAALTEDPERPICALMYVDLDNFKPINDTFGHRAGDHVLRTTAERLRSVVGAHDVCARLGGDEFAIILRAMQSTAPISAIAERVCAVIALPIAYDEDIELSVTASVGIALASDGSRTPDELKVNADAALYAVKNMGRNGHVIYSDSLHSVNRMEPQSLPDMCDLADGALP